MVAYESEDQVFCRRTWHRGATYDGGEQTAKRSVQCNRTLFRCFNRNVDVGGNIASDTTTNVEKESHYEGGSPHSPLKSRIRKRIRERS